MLKELSQVVKETGVSGDYLNEYHGLVMLFRMYKRTGDIDILEDIFSNTIKKYAERYPESMYENVITPFNKGRIKRLDEIADALNVFITKRDLDGEIFTGLIREAYILVKGDSMPRLGL